MLFDAASGITKVDQVEARYRRAVEKGLLMTQALTDQAWGHRSFCYAAVCVRWRSMRRLTAP